ncbi:putative aquaporin 4 [Agrocybe pediades]|nr:putative aquaporin 4 [Agrocybe pediades]
MKRSSSFESHTRESVPSEVGSKGRTSHKEYADSPDARDQDPSRHRDYTDTSGDEVVEVIYPNRWARYREYIREPFAEFLGVMVLIMFGNGVDCQVVLGGNTAVSAAERGSYLSINVGWAVGTAMGVWVSGGISGGHINPAVTIALATFRGFPWKKVPIYIVAQVLGGICGAAVVYANYFHALDLFEGHNVRTLKTASLFATYAIDYMTNVSAFFSEFLGTTILLIVVLAMNDKKNSPPPAGLGPLILFLLILGIGTSLGMETGYAINPARDLGPRILTAMVGYGKDVFTFRNHYWLWCPIMAPICGALFGTLVYDTMLYTGEDSILNKPSVKYLRRKNGV